MINYNLILYIGIALIVFGFILFIISEIKLRQLEVKEFKQQQLSKSFNITLTSIKLGALL